MHIPPPGMKKGQLAKKLGWKEKCMDSRLLAMTETYQKFQRVEYMVSLSCTGICGEDRTSPAGDTGNLKCAPRPPPVNDKSTALRGVTAPPRPRKGQPQVKGMG